MGRTRRTQPLIRQLKNTTDFHLPAFILKRMVDKTFTALTSNLTAQKYNRLPPSSIHTQMNSQLSFYCPLQSIRRTPDNSRKAAAESQKR
jgi:hypothetical protein